MFVKGSRQYYHIHMSNVVQQFHVTEVPHNGIYIATKGFIDMRALLIDTGKYFSAGDLIISWISTTLPRTFMPEELYFLVVTPIDSNVVMNPTVTKGGWIAGTISYRKELLSTVSNTTGFFHRCLMLPFVPSKIPSYFMKVNMFRGDIFPPSDRTGKATIIKCTENSYAIKIENIKWHRQYKDTSRKELQSVFRAHFFGTWINPPKKHHMYIRFRNNVKCPCDGHILHINVEQMIFFPDSNFVKGSVATAACEQTPLYFDMRALPSNLTARFDMNSKASVYPLIFSSNPRLLFTGDAFNTMNSDLHHPNLYEATIYAPYDINFYPTCYHTITYPITYETNNIFNFLISGIPSDGHFETQFGVWSENRLLAITLRSTSPNFLLIQGTPIAKLYLVHKTLKINTPHNPLCMQCFNVMDNFFVGNIKLPKENFPCCNSA